MKKEKCATIDCIIEFIAKDTEHKYIETEDYISDFEKISKQLKKDNLSFYDFFKFGQKEKNNIIDSLKERNNLIFSTYTSFPIKVNDNYEILNNKELEENIKELEKDLSILKSDLFNYIIYLDSDVYNVEEC